MIMERRRKTIFEIGNCSEHMSLEILWNAGLKKVSMNNLQEMSMLMFGHPILLRYV